MRGGLFLFLHEFKYEVIRVLRQKEELFWVLLFPVILGTMFHFAFDNLSNATENFHTIPAAVCLEEGTENEAFENVMHLLSDEEKQPLLELTYTDWDDAITLLEENRVRGIFKVGEDVTLHCASNDNANATTLALEQSILETILRQYRTNAGIITDIARQSPQKLPDIISMAESNADYGTALTLTSGNMDSIVQYYFNLIAMACLFTSFAGAYIAMHHQANLSALGARKCVSPGSKFHSVAAQLLSCLLSQFFCVAVNVLYLVYIIKVDFGTSLPLILLTSLIGCILGVSFGFLIGSIGRVSEPVKNGIMISVSLLCCFLSGLMIDNMRMAVESFCPLINDINPAVLISDSFLTLNIYGVTARYGANLFVLLLIAAIFTGSGCLMIRRKTYASL